MLSLVRRLFGDPKTAALRQELKAIDWARFETAYGAATKVPRHLVRLFSDDPSVAWQASHDLRAELCHQDGFVSSAALTALPFLLRALDTSGEKLRLSVLWLLGAIAERTTREARPSWERELRHELVRERARFEAMRSQANKSIAYWAEEICAHLAADLRVTISPESDRRA